MHDMDSCCITNYRVVIFGPPGENVTPNRCPGPHPTPDYRVPPCVSLYSWTGGVGLVGFYSAVLLSSHVASALPHKSTVRSNFFRIIVSVPFGS